MRKYDCKYKTLLRIQLILAKHTEENLLANTGGHLRDIG